MSWRIEEEKALNLIKFARREVDVKTTERKQVLEDIARERNAGPRRGTIWMTGSFAEF